MESLCRGTLLPTWAGMTGARETMTAGSPEFVNFSMATVAGYAAQGVEEAIWKGGTSGNVVGFLSTTGTLTTQATITLLLSQQEYTKDCYSRWFQCSEYYSTSEHFTKFTMMH